MFRTELSVYFSLFLLFLTVHEAMSGFEMTNIICTSLDESYASFEYCYLKSVNRTHKYASLKAKLHKGPVYKIKVNFAIYQRLNGYKPFLYNVTVDGCKFVLNQKSSPVTSFIFNLFAPYSNMNHSCPYDNDIIVEKVPYSYLNSQLSTVLPFPKSSYAFCSDWYGDAIKRASVNVYGTLT